MQVCIIGTGYVGLVTGTCFAELGHDVICVDKDQAKIARLLAGEMPIYEPGLRQLVRSNVQSNRLRFATDVAEAAKIQATFYFIAVGTPSHEDDGRANLSYVFAAVEDAAKSIKLHGNAFAVFVTKSTVPVGTSREVARIVGLHLKNDDFAVASNPEFMREGCAIEDFLAPDRIVVGSNSERARTLLEELYRPLTRQGRPLVVTTTVETAEMIKYASNTFLATKITFINELARLCEKIGADVEELALGMGLDKRIGDKFLNAGPGFGGSCFPKDVAALIKTANDFQSPVEIVETVQRANGRHQQLMLDKIREAFGGTVSGKTIAILGLAFKARTDDVRDSPALPLVSALRAEGAKLQVYDPEATKNARALLGDASIDYRHRLDEAVKNSDGAIIITEWDEFRKANWQKLSASMSNALLVDLRNMFSLQEAAALNISYISLGRDPVTRILL
jgi:UDPglucose 6-dehydrogenase